MKKILIVSFTDSSRDPRIIRQIEALKDLYDVTVMGTNKSHIDNIKYIKLNENPHFSDTKKKIEKLIFTITKQYEKIYWSNKIIDEVISITKNLEFDLILSNDLETLPVCLNISKKAKVYFDAHEYSPREFEDFFKWRLLKQPYFTYLCKTYLPKVDFMTTVCDRIADEYKNIFNIKKPSIITNATSYKEINTIKAIEGKKIKIIHHGAAISSRKIENMINVMKYLDDNYELDLMLVPNEIDYLEKLKDYSKNMNVKFVEPVPVNEIPVTISKYDIGIFLIEPVNFNYDNCLPNKLFEFIQARLAIAIGPSPEMAKVVKEYDCGVISEDFSAEKMAKLIKTLDYNKINYFKEKSNIAAKILCAEENSKKLNSFVSNLI